MELQRLRVPAGLADALTPAVLASLDGAPLIDFLVRQRWFGGKGQRPATARLRDATPLFGDGSAVVTRLTVEQGGDPVTYQLPLAVRPGEPDAAGAPRAVVAYVEAAGERGVLFDALEDPSFRRRLGLALATGAVFVGPGTQWVLTPFGDGGQSIASGGGEVRLIAGEQSNSSVVYDERAILKLYRRLQPGENPEVEIGELLTASAFAHAPALLGTIRFHDADGSITVAGIAQRFVPDARDGWTYALERVREQCAAPPTARVTFADDAVHLGRLTRAMHEVLANAPSRADFAPLPVTPEVLRGWAEAVDRQVRTALDLLDAERRAGRLEPALDPAAGSLLARRGEVSERVRGLVDRLGTPAGQRIRHHGDYHLGQVLRTPDGTFTIVDFEGEPARPLSERRQRHCALRDVAGMLRSFAYAAAVGLEHPREQAARWERAVREAFLAGYLGDAARPLPAYLPASRAAVARTLALFEIEKAFYELAYELNHRPDWVRIPLGALGRLLDAA
jgi:trehalose synthase-fused probable maltokinase